MTADVLRDRLTEIDGIGDARADEVIEVLEAHGAVADPDALQEARELLREALDQQDRQGGASVAFARDRVREALDVLEGPVDIGAEGEA